MGLTNNLSFIKNRKILLLFTAAISLIFGIISFSWIFWLIFDLFLSFILIIYFSNELRDSSNIHFVSITFLVIYALPSIVLILLGEIQLDNEDTYLLFSLINIGMLGYTLGALTAKKAFSFEKKENTKISRKINDFFWLTYRYRYLLALISGIVILIYGIMPLGMKYLESIAFRKETSGTTLYLKSSIPMIFSPLTIMMISIIGDLRKKQKITFLSYLLIATVILSIIAGYRVWILALFGCLLIAFQPFLRKIRYLIPIIAIPAFAAVLIMSGAVRYARSGTTISENLKNAYEYFMKFNSFGYRFLDFYHGNLSVPFNTFIDVVKNVPNPIEFDYSAPINDFSVLIPKILYPDRPLTYSEWYVKIFEPKTFKIGGGRTFYIIGFGYLFAGPIGVLIYLFLFGTLFELMNKLFRLVNDAAGQFLYSYFFVHIISFVSGCGFFGFIKTAIVLYWFIPIFLLFLFIFIINFLNFTRLIPIPSK